MRIGHRVCGGLVAAALLLGAGCGGRGPFPVNGVVTLDGQPVVGAEVRFDPATADLLPAFAMTTEGGAFSLALAGGQGALRGDYRVVVVKVEGPPVPMLPPPGMGPERFRKYREEVSARRKNVIPARYGRAETTPLRCQVPTSGKVRLELTTQGS
jgi:hypothetical protein